MDDPDARWAMPPRLLPIEYLQRGEPAMDRAQLFDRAPIAMVCLDEPGQVLAANHATAHLLGRPVNYMQRRPFVTLVAQEDQRRLVSHLTRVANGERCETDLTMVMPRGTTLPTTLVSTPIMRGNHFEYSHNAILDMSRRWQVEKTLKKASERLEHIAHHDALTGLANRYLFEDRLVRAVTRCRRNGWMGALVFVDLDRFKFYNDTFGHAVGDAILVEAATRLAMAVREQDTVCRYSGDEFLLILENITSQADVDVVLGKLRDEINRPVYGVADRPLQLSASFGATLFDKSTRDAGLLIKQADVAMYQVKKSRRDGFGYYSPQVDAVAARRRQLEADLGMAVSGLQLRLEYQAQVDIDARHISGCEALLRWEHPVRGRILPDEFIEIAEHAGLTEKIGEWVLHRACADARRWLDEGYQLDCIAVNVSARDVSSERLIGYVQDALATSGLPPSLLEIEITETSVMHQPASAAKVLGQLSELGVRLALDDFGTGYSSLRCLNDFPFNRIKIDKSFVLGLDHNEGNGAIIMAMTSMAENLGIEVIAEGVETESQMSKLAAWGVKLMQGFLFARPDSAEHFLSLLSAPLRTIPQSLPAA
ncbi:MAG: GGDEF domain-containing protein [Gammaproteobacteria bacterium]|nr:GGDEF domain-containing protein [Gammaproteobacteria bacterium]